MRVASSVDAAQDAVSGFAGVTLEGGGEQVSVGSSTVSSMKNGARFANKVVGDVSHFIAGVRAEADRVVALAKKVEARDKQDALRLGGME